MGKSIYLVNPAADFPSYWTSEVYQARGLEPAVIIADLAIATVAAFVPSDFVVKLCDECMSPINFDIGTDFVGITGKVSQWGRMKAIARRFRERGVTVIIGGPFASLSPETVRPHCDILVRGEIEEIAEGLFSDLREGQWKEEYIGTKPDLRSSPIPRWDLYANSRAVAGTVQTSRGCPFECDFCDVIEYLGRKQRHKSVEQVLAELDQLYRLGYRNVYLADDNFTVYRNRAKELLAALVEWNARRVDGAVQFATQLSIDAARDQEMVRLCAQAGFSSVFIGIETPNEESLLVAKKRQNMKRDLVADIQQFVDCGVGVTAGMIVGFDGDGPGIFDLQYDFAMSTGVSIWQIGALVAPEATPLYARLAAEKRLVLGESAEVQASPLRTNIIPKKMTRTQLLEGLERLCHGLYHPSAFGQRLMHFIETAGRAYRPNNLGRRTTPRDIELDSLELASRVRELGDAEGAMLDRVMIAAKNKPLAFSQVVASLAVYSQVHHMFEWVRQDRLAHVPQLAS